METIIVSFIQFWSKRSRSLVWPRWVLVGPSEPTRPQKAYLARAKKPG